MVLVVYLAMCLIPVAVMRLIAHGPPDLSRLTERLRLARRARDRRQEREQFVKALRRLGADHDKLMRASRPARANQMRAIERAYDETLRQACEALDVDAPEAGFDDISRVHVEADLLVRGFTW